MATALYPDLENPDRVFPTLAFDLLPVGLRGLMLAALAAAIFSSLEAILNSAATLFTMDLVKTLRPKSGDRALVWTGRIATLGFMVLAASWAPQIAQFPTLWQYLQSILAYVTPPVVAVFLLGLFWRRGNGTGAVTTFVVGVPLGVAAWIGNEILALTEIQFLYAAGLMLLASVGLFVAASLTRPPPDAERVAGFTRSLLAWRDAPELAPRWSISEKAAAALLLGLTLALVWWWR